MKPSATALASLADMTSIETTGDLRRVVANQLLALAKGEIGSANMEAMAKGLDSISNSLNTEIKIAKTKIELRDQAGELGKITHLGNMIIGGAA